MTIVIHQSVSSIGLYVKIIHTSLSEPSISIIESNEFIFAYTDNKGYLVGYNGNNTNLVLPNSFTYNDQTILNYEIRKYAFADCESLKSVTIPDSVTIIGDHSFANCYSLTTVKIGTGVTSIENNAFYRCIALRDFFLPKSFEEIGLADVSIVMIRFLPGKNPFWA